MNSKPTLLENIEPVHIATTTAQDTLPVRVCIVPYSNYCLFSDSEYAPKSPSSLIFNESSFIA